MEFIHNFTKITVKAKLGSLSDSRVAEVHSRLKASFPRLSRDKQAGLVLMVDSARLRAVILGTDDFTVSFDKTGADPDLTLASQTIKDVLDALLVTGEYEATIRTVGTLPSRTGDSMSETLGLSKMHVSGSRWEQLKGIGLRLLYDHEGGLSELKLEPLLMDPTYYYIESIVNLNRPSNPDSITANAGAALADIREYAPRIISQGLAEG